MFIIAFRYNQYDSYHMRHMPWHEFTEVEPLLRTRDSGAEKSSILCITVTVQFCRTVELHRVVYFILIEFSERMQKSRNTSLLMNNEVSKYIYITVLSIEYIRIKKVFFRISKFRSRSASAAFKVGCAFKQMKTLS